MLPIMSSMPLGLLQHLVDHLVASPNDAVSFAFTLALLSQPESNSLGLTLKLNLRGAYSTSALKKWCPSFGSSLTEINASRARFDDDFLIALAASPAARTIRSIMIPQTFLTDASTECWQRFEALEEVDISLCDHITVKTFNAVGLLPTLRKLIATSANELTLDEFDHFLAADRLPLISTLCLSTYSIFSTPEDSERAQVILARHPSLTSIDLGISNASDLQIHKILPDLRGMVTMSELRLDSAECQEILPFCSNFSWIHSPENICGIDTKEDLELLARSCPRLERLVLQTESADIGGDFSMFSALTSLVLFRPKLHETLLWPQNLVVLDIEDTSDRSGPPSDQEPLKFIESICQLTSLTELYVKRVRELGVTSVVMITTSLTQLSLLKITELAAVPDMGTLKLHSMPFLSEFGLPGMRAYVDADSLYLPSFTTTPVSKAIPWKFCNPNQFPNLTSVSMDWFLSRPDQEAIAGFMHRFCTQLRMVSDSQMRCIAPDICMKLINVERLHLTQQISDSAAADLLTGLPKLCHFRVSISPILSRPISDWLAHRNITDLQLRFEIGEPSTTAVPLIQVSGSKFPSLTRLSLALHVLHLIELHVLGLPALQFLQIRDAAPTLNLVLDCCPFLHETQFNAVSFNSIHIANVDFLSSFTASNCVFPPSDAQIRLRAPRLRNYFIVDPNGINPVEQSRLMALNELST
jgi:hypothetical protein